MNHEKLIYIHPAPVRVWHWLNAAGIVLLVVTGFQIRYAEILNLMPLKNSISLHNYAGFGVIAAYFLWLFYYLNTGKIIIYFPDPRTFVAKALKQIKFYGYYDRPNKRIYTVDDIQTLIHEFRHFLEPEWEHPSPLTADALAGESRDNAVSTTKSSSVSGKPEAVLLPKLSCLPTCLR